MLANRARGLIAVAVTTLCLWPMLAPAAKAQGQETPAAVAEAENDAARLIAAKGAWSPSVNYVKDDLVTSRGSAWRAKKASKGRVPGATLPSSATFWEQFAAGFNPLGAWLGSKKYQVNDVVLHEGASWRAKRTTLNDEPDISPADWQQFAAKGDEGDKGDSGDIGPQGQQGLPGTAGAQGDKGDQGDQGDQGIQGLQGETGAQGPAGATGLADGNVGAPSINFASSTSTGIYSPATGKIALTAGGALFLHNIGAANTAMGIGALDSNSTFSVGNTAMGANALTSTTSGSDNTAMGVNALTTISTGTGNTAVGYAANPNNPTGNSNTALGRATLVNNTTGSNNIAVGHNAGASATVASNSIFIGNQGLNVDTSTIKIGNHGTQTTAFIAGISGAVANSAGVLIDTLTGQLGTAVSSRRYKEDIAPMGDMSATLTKLRPVTFRYKQPYVDGPKPLEYGLIAEEVAEVLPALAVFNAEGQPETVKYHLLPSFLLAGYQQQQKTIEAQAAEIAALKQQTQRIATQDAEIAALKQQMQRIEALLARFDAAASSRAASLARVEP